MKNILLIIIIFLSFDTFSQGTKFLDLTWSEALILAKKKDKMIFVNVSTSRCRPCKKMKKEILPQSKVGDFLNKNFINLSVNAHEMEGLEFNMFYKFSSYPSFMYLDKNANLIYKFYGFKNAEQLIESSNFALNRYDNIMEFEEKKKTGKNNYAFIIKYIEALNRLNRPSEYLALEFLESNNVREDIRLKFIYRTISTTQGKLFSELIENIDKLKLLFKDKEVNNKVNLLYKKDIEYYSLQRNNKSVKGILKSIKKNDFLSFNELKVYSKLLKSEYGSNIKEYKQYSSQYFDLLQTDKSKREFIKTIYLKKIDSKNLEELALEFARNLYQDSNTELNQILFIKLLVVTKKFDEAEPQLKIAMKYNDGTIDNTARKKLRNYSNYLMKLRTGK